MLKGRKLRQRFVRDGLAVSVFRLYLDNKKLKNGGAKDLAGALRGNPTVRSVTLQWNGISDSGACALADALGRNNERLTQLDLSYNNIGCEGCEALARSLATGGTLLHLGLAGNLISNKGALALAQCLEQGTALTHLDLSNNKIQDKGAKALVSFLSFGTPTHKLSIDSSIRREQ